MQPVKLAPIQAEPKSIADVIDRTQRTMALCQLGLTDLLESADVTRQIAGIATVAVQGRAVTQVAQKIRSFDSGFDDWYAPYKAEMSGDELLRYFYVLRSIVLKDGAPRVSVWNSLEPHPKPLDRLGSTGLLPGIEDYPRYFKSSYVDTGNVFQRKPTYLPLPITQNIDVVLVLPGPPNRYRGELIMDQSAQGLCILYVTYLSDFVRDLIKRFTPSEKPT